MIRLLPPHPASGPPVCSTQLELELLQKGCLQTVAQMEYIRLHQQGYRQDSLGIWYSPAQQAFTSQ